MSKAGRPPRPLLESEIKAVNEVSRCGGEAAEKLGVSFPTYKKYAVMYGLWEAMKKKSHRRPGYHTNLKYSFDDLFAGKYPNYPIPHLKHRLIRSGKKLQQCENCGYKEKRITDGLSPLLVYFVDGNKKNWKFENLKLLCYNCSFVMDRNIRGRTGTKNPQEYWLNRLSWERNDLPKEGGGAANGEKLVTDIPKEVKPERDVDVTNTSTLTPEEIEAIKQEALKESQS
jgi:hypothetical protein